MGDAIQDLCAFVLREGLTSEPELLPVSDGAAGDSAAFIVHLVGAGGVPEEALAEALALSLGAAMVDLKLGALDPDALGLVSAAAARRHLMVPVARVPGGPNSAGRLRVAFANPLDTQGVEVAAAQSGMAVETMVATVSGVQAALGRDYPLLPESTRPLAPAAATPTAITGVAHRVIGQATAEQRHEALLLALVEAGVIARDDYLAILQRLIGRR